MAYKLNSAHLANPSSPSTDHVVYQCILGDMNKRIKNIQILDDPKCISITKCSRIATCLNNYLLN